MDKYEIKQDHGAYTVHEISVNWNEWRFLIIYGQRNNGEWFIALPDWNICIRATEPTNIYYNIDKLSQAFNDYDKGKSVAEAIREHWEGLQDDI